MKSSFLICGVLLAYGGISQTPAIAINPYSQDVTQSQVPSLFRQDSLKVSQGIGVTKFETELLKLTNLERKKLGLAPLKLSVKLTRAAQFHAEDMANKNYFSHTGKNGSSMADRTKVVGYKYSFLGENLAAGRATPEGTVRQWMNSTGHRANILNEKFTEIGFGYAISPNSRYRHYWVQVFGTPRN
ncbi:CAP domain-containing protein [Pseudanabaena sp. FACHB-1998]|uniref:CAP domain-containing protein n=1 Tax=Pseudanabaena sp. FACHB-1998 TaxID=2692858 RepID=UPI001680D62C|nr:CAP domain-containing protein [Pseudanabaena sp. FACHB-1998]MBD2179099.1 CAP domain-containing protein [Pseudanabaena sp. FACHB-1998]